MLREWEVLTSASCSGLSNALAHRLEVAKHVTPAHPWSTLCHAVWRPRRYLCMSGFCFLTNASAIRSKISWCVFFPSPHTQVASPAACSRAAIVIVGPVPLFHCTTSPSLNSGMGLLLCVCDEVDCPNSTQSHPQRVTSLCNFTVYLLYSRPSYAKSHTRRH